MHNLNLNLAPQQIYEPYHTLPTSDFFVLCAQINYIPKTFVQPLFHPVCGKKSKTE